MFSPTADTQALGVGIRNWGPTDDVFVVVDKQVTLTGGFHDYQINANLYWYECSNNDVCATDTLQSTLAVGTAIYDVNLTHPALAIRAGSGGAIEVLATLRQKIETDCDGDGVHYLYDSDDINNLDLGARLFSTTAGEIDDWTVRTNYSSNGDCLNNGISYARFGPGSVPFACHTSELNTALASPNDERDSVICNNEAGATSGGFWPNVVYMGPWGGATDEDHPTFDHYGASGALVTSTTYRSSGSQEIRLHFPDAVSAPPNEEIVAFPATGTKVDHSDVIDQGGKLHLAWTDNTGTSASVRYQVCDYSSTVDCSDAADWLTSDEIVADSSSGYNRKAQGAAIALDGKRQFVAWQYDQNGSNRWRVVVASRCIGGAWSYEEVRTAGAAKDQFVLVGRPPLVLNRAENVAHISLIEAENYLGGYSFGGVESGTALWLRTSYADCP